MRKKLLVTETVPCWVIVVLPSRQFAALVVPTEPSKTVAPPLVTNRAQLAVPLAAASVSCVTAWAVASPATAALKAGLPNIGEASKVCVVIAVSAVAGCGAV